MLSPENTIVVTQCVILPGAALIMNVIVRSKKEMPFSTGADIALLAIVFDFAVLVDHGPFEGLLHFTEFKEIIRAIFAILAVVSLCIWLLLVTWIEPPLFLEFQHSGKGYVRIKTWLFILGLTLSFGLLAAHMWVFWYRG